MANLLSRSAGIFSLFSRKTVAFARKRSRRRKRRTRQIHLPCCKTRLAATRRNLPGYASDTLITALCLPVAMGRCLHARACRRRGRNIYKLFPVVILSDSEGSHCRTIPKPIQRYLNNALLYLLRPTARLTGRSLISPTPKNISPSTDRYFIY